MNNTSSDPNQIFMIEDSLDDDIDNEIDLDTSTNDDSSNRFCIPLFIEFQKKRKQKQL